MRALALSGFAALAMSLMAPATVWAWSTEQATSNGSAAANLAEEGDPLKALQDKVDAKSGSKQSGFYFSAGPGEQSQTGFYSSRKGTTPPFGYSPMPGFRGQAE